MQIVVVRLSAEGRYKGWCSHRHRLPDRATACARALNKSWASTGEVWTPMAVAQWGQLRQEALRHGEPR